MKTETKSKVGSTASIALGPMLLLEGVRIVGSDSVSGLTMIGCGTAILLIREFRFKTAV